MANWIRVSDRLPDGPLFNCFVLIKIIDSDGGSYYVTETARYIIPELEDNTSPYHSSEYDERFIIFWAMGDCPYDDSDIDDHYDEIYHEVIAWMPIPDYTDILKEA